MTAEPATRVPDEATGHLVEETPEAAAPPREERIQFLTHAIAFAESNIRAYDTKSQIALAAFVFSMSPLWSILNSACSSVSSRPAAALLVFAFICTIMLYGFVLWPIRPLQGLVKNRRAQGLFFIGDPAAASGIYEKQLLDLSLEAELTGEILKLSYIRASKGRRFRYALWATGIFYLLIFASFLLLQRCV
jgi:hypothetical protein